MIMCTHDHLCQNALPCSYIVGPSLLCGMCLNVCPKRFVSFFSDFPLLTLLLEIKNNRTSYRNLKETVVWESNDFLACESIKLSP